jgi:catalase
VLVADGTDAAAVDALRTAVEKAGAVLQVVAPKIGGANGKGGKKIAADHQLAGGPSIFFDAVAVLVSPEGAATLAKEAAAIDWLRDAFGHLKVIGVSKAAKKLLDQAGIAGDEGVVAIDANATPFVRAAEKGRVWDREPRLRSPK